MADAYAPAPRATANASADDARGRAFGAAYCHSRDGRSFLRACVLIAFDIITQMKAAACRQAALKCAASLVSLIISRRQQPGGLSRDLLIMPLNA